LAVKDKSGADLEGSTNDNNHDLNPNKSTNPLTNVGNELKASSFLESDKLKELAANSPLQPPSKFKVLNVTMGRRTLLLNQLAGHVTMGRKHRRTLLSLVRRIPITGVMPLMV
jgi:hypothetical protein